MQQSMEHLIDQNRSFNRDMHNKFYSKAETPLKLCQSEINNNLQLSQEQSHMNQTENLNMSSIMSEKTHKRHISQVNNVVGKNENVQQKAFTELNLF
mmetsp:Transcript_17510/g.16733  ORF Transcript_17510/g.16733 Transcript_17510/m.16733 type:complete len:97 (+) Transcript_17510:718-1008(+)